MQLARSESLFGHKWNVLSALILRDVRTRFGRSHLGYLVAIAWPLAHLGSLVLIMSFSNKISPIGTDVSVFISTGVMPYILCLYPARMMGMALQLGKPLFLFPVISPFDIILSRAIVEIITAVLVVIVFYFFAILLGSDLMPLDIYNWSFALISIIFLAISFGIMNNIICSFFPFWNIIFIVLMLICYFTAGVFVLPSSLSQEVQYWMSFNPLFHCVEWLRSAYYEGYGDEMLSRSYLLSFATVALFIGLLGERFLRGKLLSS